MDDTKNTVAAEVALAEFARFLEAMDLDGDTSRMDADEQKAFGDLKDTVTRAVERGALVIDNAGQPVYTTRDGSTITFYEPTGATFISMDSKRSGQDMAKMFALMGDMTRTSERTFAKMAQRDLKVCRALAMLFLG